MQGGFRRLYGEQGVDSYYIKNGTKYTNPHAYYIKRIIHMKLNNTKLINRDSKILDLACGSGQVTIPLQQMGYKNIMGLDPYTSKKYIQNTGMKCLQYTFKQIVMDVLEQKFNLIICSYALHLVKEDMIYALCKKLAQLTHLLIIISPHKLPDIKENYGWKLTQHHICDRIHYRVYQVLKDHYD